MQTVKPSPQAEFTVSKSLRGDVRSALERAGLRFTETGRFFSLRVTFTVNGSAADIERAGADIAQLKRNEAAFGQMW